MCLAIPGLVVSLSYDDGVPLGVVDFGGVTREVCLSCVADSVAVGDYVIVHVGFAISVLDRREAERSLALLKEMVRGQRSAMKQVPASDVREA